MRHRSPSYGSPPRRGYGGRGRSPPRGRYSGRKDAPTSLLVRNIPRESRPDDVRIRFERFGSIKDVYLPKDYYTGEPRGFGFVQYFNPVDAAEARHRMDHQMFNGREITVVFADDNRKKHGDMRTKGWLRGRAGYGGRQRSPHYAHSRSHSPRFRSRSPRGRRHSRSYSPAPRQGRHHSRSPSPTRGRDRFSPSPDDTHGRGRVHSPSVDKSHSRHSKDGQGNSSSKGHGKLRSDSVSPLPERNSRSPRNQSRSRSSSWKNSRSPPRSPSLPPRRRRSSPSKWSLARDSAEPAQKKAFSNVTPEERSPQGESPPLGRSPSEH
eukprot:c28159_g2_i3 orf=267-1232(+)